MCHQEAVIRQRQQRVNLAFAVFSAEQIESTGARVAPALRPEMRPILSSAISGNHGFKSPYFAEILDT
jgi:hypothetical protein